ncbi:MAG: hypothetical protein OEW48_13495 [Phycisphaerae bacterium]|nr:hypothetical protein [Phycisphaerae bacterium]
MEKKKKVISKILSIIGGLTVLGVLAVLIFFLIDFFIIQKGIMFQEAYRITSPDGKVDVVGMYYDAGATTSRIEMVYIVPTDHAMTKTDLKLRRCVPVFVAEHIKGKNVCWLRDKLLEIKYETARIKRFRNSIRPLPEDVNYVVEIRQIPLKDTSLPPEYY